MQKDIVLDEPVASEHADIDRGTVIPRIELCGSEIRDNDKKQ
jgi:hypothetical protein